MRIFECGKKSDFANNFYNMLAEFVFLVSDFEPPFCGDDRAFYEQTVSGEIVLGCDRCGAAYSLDARPVQPGRRMRMSKSRFVEVFGEGTAQDWPYRRRLRRLIAGSTVSL